jgi:integrase
VLGEEFQSLRAEAYAYRNAAYATSTKRCYKSQMNCYFKFCFSHGVTPVPASQDTLVSYCAFLARSLSANSIPGYLNVVRVLHLDAGFANPLSNNWELSSVQKGISRLLGKPPVQKSPVTVVILLELYKTLTDCAADNAFWAACLVAFFGFLRKSTLLPTTDMLVSGRFISRGDIVNITLSSFSMIVKQSKTNQFGQRILSLPYIASTDARICPVRAVLKHLGSSSLPATTPLFNFVQSGLQVAFTHAFFVKRLKSGLLQTGNDASSISCHSFRRGGATLAFAVGMSAIDIKLRGDWKSNAFERYVVVSPESASHSISVLTRGAEQIAFSN